MPPRLRPARIFTGHPVERAAADEPPTPPPKDPNYIPKSRSTAILGRRSSKNRKSRSVSRTRAPVSRYNDGQSLPNTPGLRRPPSIVALRPGGDVPDLPPTPTTRRFGTTDPIGPRPRSRRGRETRRRSRYHVAPSPTSPSFPVFAEPSAAVTANFGDAIAAGNRAFQEAALAMKVWPKHVAAEQMSPTAPVVPGAAESQPISGELANEQPKAPELEAKSSIPHVEESSAMKPTAMQSDQQQAPDDDAPVIDPTASTVEAASCNTDAPALSPTGKNDDNEEFPAIPNDDKIIEPTPETKPERSDSVELPVEPCEQPSTAETSAEPLINITKQADTENTLQDAPVAEATSEQSPEQPDAATDLNGETALEATIDDIVSGEGLPDSSVSKVTTDEVTMETPDDATIDSMSATEVVHEAVQEITSHDEQVDEVAVNTPSSASFTDNKEATQAELQSSAPTPMAAEVQAAADTPEDDSTDSEGSSARSSLLIGQPAGKSTRSSSLTIGDYPKLSDNDSTHNSARRSSETANESGDALAAHPDAFPAQTRRSSCSSILDKSAPSWSSPVAVPIFPATAALHRRISPSGEIEEDDAIIPSSALPAPPVAAPPPPPVPAGGTESRLRNSSRLTKSSPHLHADAVNAQSSHARGAGIGVTATATVTTTTTVKAPRNARLPSLPGLLRKSRNLLSPTTTPPPMPTDAPTKRISMHAHTASALSNFSNANMMAPSYSVTCTSDGRPPARRRGSSKNGLGKNGAPPSASARRPSAPRAPYTPGLRAWDEQAFQQWEAKDKAAQRAAGSSGLGSLLRRGRSVREPAEKRQVMTGSPTASVTTSGNHERSGSVLSGDTAYIEILSQELEGRTSADDPLPRSGSAAKNSSRSGSRVS